MKRKSEYPEVFEQVELKKVKGAKKSVLCKFLFISSTPHTRIIQPSFRLPRSVQVQNSTEII